MLAVSDPGGEGKDAHAYITSLNRDIGLTGKMDIGARAKELWRRDARSNARCSTDEVLDEALAPLATVMTAQVAIVPALDGSSGIVDEGV